VRLNEAGETKALWRAHQLGWLNAKRNALDQFVERGDQSTDQQNEAKGEDEAEDSKLGVITGSRRVPSVEELNQRREKRSQAEKQNPELEKTPHSLSIERTPMFCCSTTYPCHDEIRRVPVLRNPSAV